MDGNGRWAKKIGKERFIDWYSLIGFMEVEKFMLWYLITELDPLLNFTDALLLSCWC